LVFDDGGVLVPVLVLSVDANDNDDVIISVTDIVTVSLFILDGRQRLLLLLVEHNAVVDLVHFEQSPKVVDTHFLCPDFFPHVQQLVN